MRGEIYTSNLRWHDYAHFKLLCTSLECLSWSDLPKCMQHKLINGGNTDTAIRNIGPWKPPSMSHSHSPSLLGCCVRNLLELQQQTRSLQDPAKLPHPLVLPCLAVSAKHRLHSERRSKKTCTTAAMVRLHICDPVCRYSN